MSIKIEQKYRLKKPRKSDVDIRVVEINNQWVEVERCEHHEGLAHDTFPLKIEHLLQNYALVSEVADD